MNAPADISPDVAALTEQLEREKRRRARQREKMMELKGALRDKTAFALSLQKRLIQEAVARGEDLQSDDLRSLSPVERYEADDATGTTVSFAGLLTNFGMPQAEFHGTLKDTGQSLVFVKDFEQMWYQRGLLGLCETRRGLADVLRPILADLPRPWTFIGSSAGAYAALFIGALMGAERIVAFAPQTLVDFEAFTKYTDTRPKLAGYDVDDPENNLRNVLEATPLTGQAHVHFGTQNEFDSAQAARIAGLPGVNLVQHDTTNHSIARMLRNKGELLSALYPEARA
jgi:hypothetical protein